MSSLTSEQEQILADIPNEYIRQKITGDLTQEDTARNTYLSSPEKRLMMIQAIAEEKGIIIDTSNLPASIAPQVTTADATSGAVTGGSAKNDFTDAATDVATDGIKAAKDKAMELETFKGLQGVGGTGIAGDFVNAAHAVGYNMWDKGSNAYKSAMHSNPQLTGAATGLGIGLIALKLLKSVLPNKGLKGLAGTVAAIVVAGFIGVTSSETIIKNAHQGDGKHARTDFRAETAAGNDSQISHNGDLAVAGTTQLALGAPLPEQTLGQPA